MQKAAIGDSSFVTSRETGNLSRRAFIASALAVGAAACSGPANNQGESPAVAIAPESTKRPNFLLFMTDNQSWLHTASTGTPQINTPAFDRIAKEGVLFNNAYTPCPSCSPARCAVLTGQDIWRLGEGGVLWSTVPKGLPVYPNILEDAGYATAWCGKSWAPGYWDADGRDRHPAGEDWNESEYKEDTDAVSSKDYAADFDRFMNERDTEKPFCFWLGTHEPHRDYPEIEASEEDLAQVELPAFLPDAPEIREDFLAYYSEIEHADRHLARVIETLEAHGELENTVIVVTSDNGMQVPRGITCLYDYGVRVPFAIRWGANCPPGRTVDDFTNLTDLAPTFLEAAGIPIPNDMTGRSLLPTITSSDSGQADPSRDHVITAMERHTLCREGELPYPSRAIRTADYLYIRNFEPDRWPAGGPDHHWTEQGIYGDIDAGPTKTWMLDHQDDPEVKPLFDLGFGKRPAEELYSVPNDPDHMVNLADDPDHADAKKMLNEKLMAYLEKTNDPRTRGESPWDHYPYRYPMLRRFRDNITNESIWPKR